MVRVLFVCLGNICRSPTAEAVFSERVERAGLSESIEIDSAGTYGYHADEPPDARARQAAGVRGYDLSPLRARQVRVGDFERFDYVVAMDLGNRADLRRLSPDDRRDRVRMFVEFGNRFDVDEVPDPYSGTRGGFDYVLDLIEDCSDGLLAFLVSEHGLAPPER